VYLAQGAIEDIIKKAIPALGAAQSALDDPALGETVCLATQLSRLADGKDPGRACARTANPNSDKGLGLSAALPGLRAFVWVRKNPIVASALVGTVIGLVWAVGYSTGAKRRTP